MHPIKFRVFTKFKTFRLLELNGRLVSKSHQLHGTLPYFNYLPGNQRHVVLLSRKFTLNRTDHPCIRSYLEHRTFFTYGPFNLIDKRMIEKQQEFLLNTKNREQLQLRRCHNDSGNNNKDNSKDIEPKSKCAKQRLPPAVRYSKDNEVYIYQDIKKQEKRKGVNKRKCGKTPEDLKKCLKTLQDIVDYVHPMMPYALVVYAPFVSLEGLR